MTNLYIAAAALLCITASIVCWALARRHGLGGKFWPFLALAAALLLARELLPGVPTLAAGPVAPTPEQLIRRSSGEIAEETRRLSDEIRRQMGERPCPTVPQN